MDRRVALFASREVVDALGLSPGTPEALSSVGLIALIDSGLPVKALDHVARLLAPGDAQFKHRLIPKATFNRRKAEHRLSSEEGTRLARLARVWGLARDVWGSDEEARDFLFRPHPMAEDKRPVDLVIQNEFGAELVVDILGRLKYGTAA
jgi:putative toxin-antitoxin system antitoxin component (TIGR02293 family)